MRFLPTRLHAWGDYLTVPVLFALPAVFDFGEAGGAATMVCVVAGAAVLMLTLMTNYEGGVLRAVPMPVHLLIDGALGVALLAAAAGFAFAYDADDAFRAWVPLAAVGAGELVASLVTKKRAIVPAFDIEKGAGPG